MNNFCIISLDRLFARMLELELKEIGLTVKTITEKLNPPALRLSLQDCTAAVFDGNYYGMDLSFAEKENKPFIIFSEEQLSDTPRNTVAFFERPFPIAEFKKVAAEISAISPLSREEQKGGFDLKSIELDMFSKQARYNGKTVKFTPREFALLSLLYRNRGRIVSRKEVIETVWGEEYDMKNNADNVYINYLRNKLDGLFGVKVIYTVRGKGYMMK